VHTVLNYLKAELFKGARWRAALPMALLLGSLVALLLLLTWATSTNWQLIDSVTFLLDMLILGFFLLILPASAVFSEQYKHKTLKNEVCFGIPRVRVYLGKLLASVVMAAILCAWMMLLWLGLSAALFQAAPREELARAAAKLGLGLLTALPLWLGALGLFHALQFTLKSTTLVYVLYLGYFIAVEPIVGLLGLLNEEKVGPVFFGICSLLSKCALSWPLEGLSVGLGLKRLAWAWPLGLGWLAVTTAVGLALFRRQDIQ